MPGQKDYYKILGVPRTATAAEIKRNYRELARKYHPDVFRDKRAGARAFVRITEAYKTLIDPEKRRAYDSTLDEITQVVPPPGSTYRSSPGSTRPQGRSRAQEVQRLVKEAEMAFIRKRLDDAISFCRMALKQDATCARAHAILGDVYRARKLFDHAINEYNYAVQYDPSDKDSEKKLEKLVGKARPITFSWERPDGRISTQTIMMLLTGWGMAFFLLFLVYAFPGKPVWWLKFDLLTLPWSWNLIAVMIGDGALVGFLLGVSGITGHPDDELIFETGGRGHGIIPTGLLVLFFSPLFFWGSAVLYIVVGFIQDTISWNIVKVFLAIIAITLVSAALYLPDRRSVLFFGGNVVFIGALCGWYLGAMLRGDP